MTEFFNNIWIALSTQNQGLIKLLSIPLAFLESSLILYFICTILNLKILNREKILYIICTALVSLISLFFLSSPFNIIFNYISLFIVIHFTLKTNLLRTIIAAILPSLLFLIAESLVFNPYITLLNITYSDALFVPIYKLPVSFLMYLIIFLFTFVIRHKKVFINVLDDVDKKSKSAIIANLIFGLVYIIVEVMITMKYIDILPLAYTFSNFIMLLLYFCINLSSISKVAKLSTTTKQLESAEEYNKTLHILHDNVRGFKHDFDNIVTTIGGYINTNDMEGLKKYYVQLEHDCERVNNLYILNPNSINNPGIYNLLTSKYHEAIQKGIDVNIYYLLDLNDLQMEIYDFARILGILLDNAIDASEHSKEKVINISFGKDHRKNQNIIFIENSYANKDVDINRIFEKGITEKENHTGLGLWEVRKILSKNHHVHLHTTKTDTLFKQQLEIHCESK